MTQQDGKKKSVSLQTKSLLWLQGYISSNLPAFLPAQNFQWFGLGSFVALCVKVRLQVKSNPPLPFFFVSKVQVKKGRLWSIVAPPPFLSPSPRTPDPVLLLSISSLAQSGSALCFPKVQLQLTSVCCSWQHLTWQSYLVPLKMSQTRCSSYSLSLSLSFFFFFLQSFRGGGVRLRLWDSLAAAMATERGGGS